jgi:hypothetical protein
MHNTSNEIKNNYPAYQFQLEQCSLSAKEKKTARSIMQLTVEGCQKTWQNLDW